MKRCWMVAMVLTMTLWGCGNAQVFEQVQDVYRPVEVAPAQLLLELPGNATQTVMSSDANGTLYFCDGYTLTVQTLAGGDLDRTLRTATGYSRDALTVLETASAGLKRYLCAWTSAGEGGDQVGRLLCLDDGEYHYVITVMAAAEQAGALQAAWDDLFSSVTLGNTDS